MSRKTLNDPGLAPVVQPCLACLPGSNSRDALGGRSLLATLAVPQLTHYVLDGTLSSIVGDWRKVFGSVGRSGTCASGEGRLLPV